jgi:hypothetical protein
MTVLSISVRDFGNSAPNLRPRLLRLAASSS